MDASFAPPSPSPKFGVFETLDRSVGLRVLASHMSAEIHSVGRLMELRFLSLDLERP
jgi:hypothetical protein